MVLQRIEVADSGIAAIELPKGFHFFQGCQVGDAGSGDLEALQVGEMAHRTEVVDPGIADVERSDIFEFG